VGIGDIKAGQQPLQLTLVDRDYLVNGLRPFEPILFQALLPQTKTVAIPVEDFDDVSLPIAENKKIPGKRIMPQRLFHQDAEPINGFAHVRAADCQVYETALGGYHGKDRIVAISRRKSPGSKSGRISIARSLSMISRSEPELGSEAGKDP